MKVLCESPARVVCPCCGQALTLPRVSAMRVLTQLLRDFVGAHGAHCPAGKEVTRG